MLQLGHVHTLISFGFQSVSAAGGAGASKASGS